MDMHEDRPGYFLELPEGPPRPWLRLAHRWDPPPALCPGYGLVRTLADFEFFLVLRGTSWLWLADQHAHLPLTTGSLALIPPGLRHAYGETDCAHLAVHADLYAQPELGVPAMMQLHGQRVGPGPLAQPVWISLSQGAHVVRYPLVQRVREPAAWAARFAPLITAYGSGTHDHLAARIEAAGILGSAFTAAFHGHCDPDPVAQVLHQLASEQPIPQRSVAELARQAGLGETAFRAAVKRLTGRQPQAHWTWLRLQQAAHLLTSTSLSIQAIASTVGYADPFHFSRVFTRQFAQSPRAWRRQQSGLPAAGNV